MNSIDVLTRQHRFVEELLDKLRQTGEDGDRLLLLGRLSENLLIHSLLEARYFYPVIRRHGLEAAADRSLEEGSGLRQLIRELANLEPDDVERRDALAGRLEEHVRRHILSEESAVFPRVRTRVPMELLDSVGQGMHDAIAELRLLDLHHLLDFEAPNLRELTRV